VKVFKDEMKSLESLRRPIQDISRLTKEIQDLDREVRRCETALGESGGSLSAAEIRSKMDSLTDQRGKLQRDIKLLAAEKEKARMRIQGLKDAVAGTKALLAESESELAVKRRVLKDIDEAKAQLNKAQGEIKVPVLLVRS
jgi:DNA repair protein RAD50